MFFTYLVNMHQQVFYYPYYAWVVRIMKDLEGGQICPTTKKITLENHLVFNSKEG